MKDVAERPFVVLSPGSRSTPLVVALARAADAGEIELVDVLDERSAAFVALGHARATGRPAFVVATSGTAPAHWYPAVLEASEAQLPLVLLSADRPTELHHCGAPQTVDQLALFGAHVRFFADLGDPQASDAWLCGVRRTVAHAVSRAKHGVPGPVHVNFRARKPLEPHGAPDATARMADAVLDAITGHGVVRVTRALGSLAHVDAARIAKRLLAAERPLVVLGPLAPQIRRADVASFLARLGAPFYAEPSSQLRFGERPSELALDGLDLILESGALGRDGVSSAPDPDVVVVIGATPTSSALEHFFGTHPNVPRLLVGTKDRAPPPGNVEEMVVGDVDSALAAITARLPERSPPSTWVAPLKALDERAWLAVDRELHSAQMLAEGAVAQAACDAIPAGGALLLGNSLPIRLVDRFVRGERTARTVLSQRGVNGIDGLVSGAIGGGRALHAPLLALLGDLTTLHDIGALAAAPRVGPPLVIVSIRNGGGRIFEQLPIARRSDLALAMPHMVTEADASLAEVARGLGVRGVRVEALAELRSALASAMTAVGTTLIEAVVPPHDAQQRETRLRAAMAVVEATA